MDIERRLQELRNLNIHLRRRWEIAETFLPAVNALIEQLALLETDLRITFVGNVLRERPYDSQHSAMSSGQVAQAALRFPDGLGVLLWDGEEYLEASQQSAGLTADSERHFVPLNECSKALWALLVEEAITLLDQLLRTVKPHGEKSLCPS